MENNMYNLGQVSKKTVDNQKRIEKQAGDFLTESYRKAREEEAAKNERLNEAVMSAARLGYAQSIERSKNRVRALEEEIKYTNNAVTIAMTEMVAQVVEAGLLLDEEEYAKLNPTYKDDIRTTVRSLLENANVETTDNPDTLALMEYVSKELPKADVGKYLTEAEISQLFKKENPVKIEESIRKLSGNVSNRVATLVEKEQKKVDEIQKNIDEVAGPAKEEEAAPAAGGPTADDVIEGLQSGDLKPEDVDALVKDGTIAPEVADEAMTRFGSEEAPAEAAPEMGAPAGVPGATPKKQIQMLPDGTLNVNIYENTFVRETPRCGLIESLAVNEAVNMLEEGKEYNSDLCLANAIMYVTVTEALDELGLVKADKKAYAKVISAAGGNLAESARGEKLIMKGHKIVEKGRKMIEKGEKINAKEDNKNYKNQTGDKFVKLEESCVIQWKPNMNQTSDLDLAERIRQKRLLKEQAENLNE